MSFWADWSFFSSFSPVLKFFQIEGIGVRHKRIAEIIKMGAFCLKPSELSFALGRRFICLLLSAVDCENALLAIPIGSPSI